VAEFHSNLREEIYETPSFDSEPGSAGRNGDGTNAAEEQLLQRQGMLQHRLLQKIVA
jgi:hypothetical protein